MVSMADVARAAKVSRTTVSLVLNNRQVAGVNISEATRVRVKNTAQELGYRTNQLALSVATGKSRMIGCVGLDILEGQVLSVGTIIAAAVHYASEHDYSIKLLPVKLSVREIIDFSLSYCLEGLIVRSRNADFIKELAAQAKQHNLRMILIDSAFSSPPVASVVGNDSEGMMQMVDYLVSLGYNRLVYTAFEQFQPFSLRRCQGFLNCVNKWSDNVTGVVLNTDTGANIPVFVRTAKVIEEYVWQNGLPDAFVCNCDESAMVTEWTLWRNGYKIPQDVAVTGFGNVAAGELACPPLTTVQLPYDAMVKLALSLLLSEQDIAQTFELPMSIKIRASVGNKRKGD